MSRNKVKVEQYTRYHELTGRPYKHWSASANLGRGGYHCSRGFIVREHAIKDLMSKLSEVSRFASLAIATLQKKEKET